MSVGICILKGCHLKLRDAEIERLSDELEKAKGHTEIVGYMVHTADISTAALYPTSEKDDAFSAAKRWGACITALVVHPSAPDLQVRTAITDKQAKEYADKNPLGGPATMFYAIGDRIRAGDPMDAVLDDYGLRFTDKQEAPQHSERKP